MTAKITDALTHANPDKKLYTTIQITGNATEISDDDWNALRDCYHDNSEWENLTDLNLSGMTQLTKIAGLDESSSSSRQNMGRLINATLPEQISAIESFAFSDCFNLKLNKLPNSLTTIGDGAFNNCKKLALTALPAEVDHIGERAFSYCGLLELTELPSRLTTIEAYAFSNCAALNLDKLPDSVKHIGNGAFYTCDKLALTVLPAALETIGADAFGYCPALNLSSLPASVSAIGEKAFRNCRGLKAMDLSGCTNLTAIPNDLFYECVSLTQVTLPDSVVSIGNQAFAGCILLAAIDLPSSTNALGEDAFSFCSVLSSVRFRAVSCPALATGAFSGVADSGTVFIPYGADGYDAAWLAAHFPAGWQLVTLGGPEEEQATLTPGGTYWFDLSGVDIPGTRNGSLPDGSLRWSPFTYAGTVNAYVLNNASDGQPGAADDAANTTDPAGTYGYRYDHSLFISEYNLSSDASWRELNGAGLLFGKDYISGGAGYILRAPSVGNLSSGTGDHTRGLPLSNEWDSILAGGSTYIKNWTDVYSLGQDTTAQGYALRGYDASHGWNDTDSAGIDARPGYRPVLEALAPNTLKAIRLHLSGGTLAGADQIGNMDIVYAGDSFTAPSADGFARPAGKNGDYFMWRGNDGSLYAAGAAVPASVTSLTAVWEDPEPSGSGGGGGGGGGGGSSYCRRTLTDKPTGLTVSGEQIHVSAVLSITTGTLHDAGEAGCDLLRAAEKAGRLLGVFDVSLSYGFRGKLSVSLPVADHDGQVLTVAHCLDGKLTLTDAKAANGLITVETDSLSPFAVLDGAYTKADLEQFLLPFTDVRESDWFHNAVLYVYINGLMNGTSQTTFEPYGGSSRAMLATILYRMEGTPSILGEGRAFFTDILAGRWYTDAVTWCAANGLAKGYGNGRFGPDDPLTREQLVTLLYRYAAWKGWDTSAGSKTDLHSYPDAAQVSGWAVPAFQWACGAGIVEGMTDGRLAPKAGANRAELAQILARLLPKYASQPNG
ncbi:leucine-rich repeat protein [Agathobaculum sp. NTUH-O15-33]|uniref:leucine-rich repeat protein n=1 Tax=Agathobaculum sp. NTUH-O15-33 TaxID=3079302 RepID=UPI0029584E56|nr:leucine-rich repeat protein [Agathobaculum sp. NTUH-O15-33]WNX86297.1 leucine-rich repeat protein [Agathobaculum sp. NTUH-O15-33]